MATGSTPEDLDQQSREARRRALDALRLMRAGRSMSAAARLARTTPETMEKYVGTELGTDQDGRRAASEEDDLIRPMVFLTEDGRIPVEIVGSRDASRLALYEQAADEFLRTGEDFALRDFDGDSVIDADGNEHFFLTDLDVLERLANVGEVSFEDLYTG